MNLPGVMIVSSTKERACRLTEAIGAKRFADVNNTEYYQLEIDNKYYAARLLLCVVGGVPAQLSSKGVEALVLYYDPKDPQQSVAIYEPLVKSLTDADVLLLVCDAFPDGDKRDAVTEWCHIHKFELIEMSPTSTNVEFGKPRETFGVERVLEALNTHTWPNRVHKGFVNRRRRVEQGEELLQINRQMENMDLTSDYRNPANRLDLDRLLAIIMAGENIDISELYDRMPLLRNHIQTLPTKLRKKAAEQLTRLFWRGLGGNPNEFPSDCSSGDELS